ncbi:unnamed protein product [Ambrosiozyma monospora]|uniref:Unnamed protein product n=1 Tax=Ambrosiozyma monospora TaxID=43982 RepID=A0A9W6YWF6_AMBMO|nr:unnamed protein product [Ambrosiozyma monospora]
MPETKQTEDSGASAAEQVIEAARRNNVDLLNSIYESYASKPDQLISLLNSAKDATGNSALHLCCKYGNYEVMDNILDLEGVNVNPQHPLTLDTPLHYAVNYSFEEPDYALFLIENLIEVGADVKLKNKDGLKPVQLLGDSNEKIRDTLESAEYAINVKPEAEGEVVEDLDSDDDAK